MSVTKDTSSSIANFLLETSNELKEATQKLFRLDNTLGDICSNIVKPPFGYDFAAIQLIRVREGVIETVYGNGVAKAWSGIAKHPLAEDEKLRDIQADVAQRVNPLRIEIIKGWYEKFDPWIYDKYEHDKYVRVWVPIVVLRDKRGNVLEGCKFEWEHKTIFQGKVYDEIEEREKREGYRVAIDVYPSIDIARGKEIKLEVIGTVDVGYCNPNKSISVEQALELFLYVTSQANNIRQLRLQFVLELITERAMNIVEANSASLHFSFDPLQEGYTYKVTAGDIDAEIFERFPPRQHGLGNEALEMKSPRYIPDRTLGHDKNELSRLNPDLYKYGIKAMAAFPLNVGDKQGVLYIHFRNHHWFTEDEIYYPNLYAIHAMDAIRDTIAYRKVNDRANALANLHAVSQSLAGQADAPDLLHQIASSTANILGADVITIYECVASEHIIVVPPEIAGKLKYKEELSVEINENSAPSLLLRCSIDQYANSSVDNGVLRYEGKPKESAFIDREIIASSAGLLLKEGDEVVGIMFINYRRPHSFVTNGSDDKREIKDKEVIDILLSAAVIAIKNRRLLKTLRAITHEIITTLNVDKLLQLIVTKAVTITGADTGELRCIRDPISQDLVVQAIYPENEPVNSEWSTIKIGEGVQGRVAENKRGALINDVRLEDAYKLYFQSPRSILSVPLLNGGGRVLGVLTVGSKNDKGFNQRMHRLLEYVADQAVIAIKNAETQNSLLAAETVAQLGDVAAQWIHWMRGGLGAIRVRANEIIHVKDKVTREKASAIISVADSLLKDGTKLQSWIPEKPELINIRSAILEAKKQARISPSVSSNLDKFSYGLPSVSAGPRQLLDVFTNLIQNAIDAMPNGGELSVNGHVVETGGRRWIVTDVKDTGIGIAKENIERIFQRGYTTKVTDKGLGFGLWWSRAYIERIGGVLTVKSMYGDWTQFTVTLPVSEDSTFIG